MRLIPTMMAALAVPAIATGAPTPLDRAEPLFMAARYPASFAVLRDYQPAVRTLRLDFMVGVSGCLDGNDDDRAFGLMILNAIPASYALTTSQAVKLHGYITRCQPAEGIVAAPVVPDNGGTDATTGAKMIAESDTMPTSDGHGATYNHTMLAIVKTKDLAAISPSDARRNEAKMIARFPGAKVATADQLRRFSVAPRVPRAVAAPSP